MNEALFNNALRLHQNGNLAEAAKLYRLILQADPKHFRALYLLGFVQFQSGDFASAEQMMGRALALNPHAPDAWYNRGCALMNLSRHEEAIECFTRALALQPQYDEALTNRGMALAALNRHEEAFASLDQTLLLKPNDIEALSGRGSALLALGREPEALASFERVVQLAPFKPEFWTNRGSALARMKRYEDAVASYDRALAVNPSYERAHINKALALAAANQPEAALAVFDAAVSTNPNGVSLRAARGDALLSSRRYEDAARDYQAVLELEPQHKYTRGNLAFCSLYCCDWQTIRTERAAIADGLNAGNAVINPFQNVTLSDSPEAQLKCARMVVEDKYPPAPPIWRGEVYRHSRLRIAYLSADFNEQPVSTLMAGVFEEHDHSAFETIAVSFLRDEKSPMRRRLLKAFDRFVDVEDKSDSEVARLLRAAEIDIAVDLMGYTGASRPGIFAFRPAPIQVNYLGFPGTTGAGYIDYIVADKTIIPEDSRRYYSEHVVYLPDTYLPTDSKRPIAAKPSRRDAGLPERGFVFCSFNNSYKFSPETFDVWMRLLSGVEESVLWLAQVNETAMRNLRREAELRGVRAERIVFARFVPDAADHLARLSLADLFLDTRPYNAHTTAADALWAGVPVLTTPGNTFAGRVAASLLHAIGMPELIADSVANYEVQALSLARDPELLKTTKAKLAGNRETQALFNTRRFTRNLETAYVRMKEETISSAPQTDP